MTHAYVRDIMTTDVVAVHADASCQDMTALLREHRVSGLPVVDDDRKVLGVVSESDLLTAGIRLHRTQPQATKPVAADLMTRPAVTIGPDETAGTAAHLMAAHKLRRLPVVDRHRHLMGILSRVDVLSVFTRPDEQIRREVTQDVLMDGFFLDPAPFTVTVQDGIVTLAGAIGSVVLGRNIADQAGRVEGVVAVRDRFTYPASAQAQAPVG
jgi:CBS-domain-containing membrane protein